MSLGIALLGTGTIANHAFAPAVQATDGAQLVAVLSRDQRRGAAFAQRHGIPAVYDDLATLLRSPQVDAVIVATPDATHEPQVIAAAQAGKHILCEKPMTTTVAGCQRMAEVIRASGITFAMGYTWRFNAGARTMVALPSTVVQRTWNASGVHQSSSWHAATQPGGPSWPPPTCCPQRPCPARGPMGPGHSGMPARQAQ